MQTSEALKRECVICRERERERQGCGRERERERERESRERQLKKSRSIFQFELIALANRKCMSVSSTPVLFLFFCK